MIRILRLFLVLGVLPAFGQAPTNGLVAHYLFSGNTADSSGYGNDATAADITYGSDMHGRPASAGSFNGTSSLVSGPTRTTSQPGLTTTALIYPSGLQAAQLFYLGNSASSGYGIRLGQPGAITHSIFILFLQGGVAESTNADSNYIIPNQWQHIALVRDANNLILYRNGRIIGTTSLNCNNDVSPIYLGSEPANIQNRHTSLNGLLDNARIYDRALSAQEIANVYRADTAGMVTASRFALSNQANVYPTFIEDGLNIDLPSSSDHGTVSIYDMTGKRILQASLIKKNTVLFLSTMPAGSYAVRVHTIAGDKTHRIVKQ